MPRTVRSNAAGQLALALSLAITTIGTGQARAQPATGNLEQTGREFGKAYADRDYARAVVLARRLAELEPSSARNRYNLACAAALAGDPDAAVAALTAAIGLGFVDVELAANDPDLRALRSDPRFTAALTAAGERRAETVAAFAREAPDLQPMVVAPPGVGRAAPVIVALHGYGGNNADFVELYTKVAHDAGAILVLPQAVRKTARGGFEWGTADEAELLIDRALARVGKEHGFDAERVVLTGFSQGGFVAFTLGLRHPERFRGVIPVAGRYLSSMLLAAPPRGEGSQQRVYMMIGAEDDALASNREAKRELEAAGIPVRMQVYDGVGHSYPRASYRELRRALKFVLAGE